MSILFKNTTVLTKKDGKYEAIKNAYLGVEGKTIDYIGTTRPDKRYDEEKDLARAHYLFSKAAKAYFYGTV